MFLKLRVSYLTNKLNRNKAASTTDMEAISQPDNYPDVQAFCETNVTIHLVPDVPVDSVEVCGTRKRSQRIKKIESVPTVLLSGYKILPTC